MNSIPRKQLITNEDRILVSAIKERMKDLLMHQINDDLLYPQQKDELGLIVLDLQELHARLFNVWRKA